MTKCENTIDEGLYDKEYPELLSLKGITSLKS